MKAPAFWSRPADRPGWAVRLLGPAALVWRAGAAWRRWRARPVSAPVPVLCIGNLTAGGAGKSPMVAALVQRLAERGIAAHVVSRGHGGSERGPYRVDGDRDRADRVGDEPLMLSALGPVWVARNRAAGALAAAEAGAGIVILDDGFQNPGLVHDAAIVMVDAGQGFGNGRVIPAGPLREPVTSGLARADLVVLVGDAAAREHATRRWRALGTVPLVGAELVPVRTGLQLTGAPVVAFAGIGRPEKFFATLRGMGAQVLSTHAFADHEPYAPQVLRRLLAEKERSGAMLVTTEKDAARLPDAFRQEVLTVPVRLEPEDWRPIDALLEHCLPRLAGPGGPSMESPIFRP